MRIAQSRVWMFPGRDSHQPDDDATARPRLIATISESKPCDRRLPFNCIAGIAIMRTVAYYISWSKRQQLLPKPAAPPSPKPA
jgi:hypothetical protein